MCWVLIDRPLLWLYHTFPPVLLPFFTWLPWAPPPPPSCGACWADFTRCKSRLMICKLSRPACDCLLSLVSERHSHMFKKKGGGAILLCGPAPVIHGTPGPWVLWLSGSFVRWRGLDSYSRRGRFGFVLLALIRVPAFCPPGDTVPKCQPRHRGRKKSEKWCRVV